MKKLLTLAALAIFAMGSTGCCHMPRVSFRMPLTRSSCDTCNTCDSCGATPVYDYGPTIYEPGTYVAPGPAAE